MNFELVPCCIEGCEESGKYEVTGDHGSVQMCIMHALHVVELVKKQGKHFVAVEDDDGED